MTTPQGLRVVVIAKETNSSSSSIGFVLVEIESNGIQTHVQRSKLRELNPIGKTPFRNKDAKPTKLRRVIIVYSLFAALFLFMLFHFFSR